MEIENVLNIDMEAVSFLSPESGFHGKLFHFWDLVNTQVVIHEACYKESSSRGKTNKQKTRAKPPK